jgi:hypothetical protein
VRLRQVNDLDIAGPHIHRPVPGRSGQAARPVKLYEIVIESIARDTGRVALEKLCAEFRGADQHLTQVVGAHFRGEAGAAEPLRWFDLEGDPDALPPRIKLVVRGNLIRSEDAKRSFARCSCRRVEHADLCNLKPSEI